MIDDAVLAVRQGMMAVVTRLALVATALLLGGCATVAPDLGAERPVPVWVEAPPHSDGETFYFLGVSSPQASRRAAHDDAVGHALTQFLLYAGAETARYAEYATLEQDLDVAHRSVERIVVTIEAFVRRFRVQRTHYRLVSSNAGPMRVEAYVLAAIPQDELTRIESSIRERWARRVRAETGDHPTPWRKRPSSQ